MARSCAASAVTASTGVANAGEPTSVKVQLEDIAAKFANVSFLTRSRGPTTARQRS